MNINSKLNPNTQPSIDISQVIKAMAMQLEAVMQQLDMVSIKVQTIQNVLTKKEIFSEEDLKKEWEEIIKAIREAAPKTIVSPDGKPTKNPLKTASPPKK